MNPAPPFYDSAGYLLDVYRRHVHWQPNAPDPQSASGQSFWKNRRLRPPIILPVISLICMFGIYSVRNSIFDVGS